MVQSREKQSEKQAAACHCCAAQLGNSPLLCMARAQSACMAVSRPYDQRLRIKYNLTFECYPVCIKCMYTMQYEAVLQGNSANTGMGTIAGSAAFRVLVISRVAIVVVVPAGASLMVSTAAVLHAMATPHVASAATTDRRQITLATTLTEWTWQPVSEANPSQQTLQWQLQIPASRRSTISDHSQQPRQPAAPAAVVRGRLAALVAVLTAVGRMMFAVAGQRCTPALVICQWTGAAGAVGVRVDIA